MASHSHSPQGYPTAPVCPLAPDYPPKWGCPPNWGFPLKWGVLKNMHFGFPLDCHVRWQTPHLLLIFFYITSRKNYSFLSSLHTRKLHSFQASLIQPLHPLPPHTYLQSNIPMLALCATIPYIFFNKIRSKKSFSFSPLCISQVVCRVE